MKKLRMIQIPLLALISCLLLGCGSAIELTPEMRVGADKFLTLLDRGNYVGAWESSATIFKNSVTREDWDTQIGRVRGALGKAKTRTQRDAVNQKDPSNHPPGEYVLITFESGFERDDVLETLVLFRQDKEWLLAGYFIK